MDQETRRLTAACSGVVVYGMVSYGRNADPLWSELLTALDFNVDYVKSKRRIWSEARGVSRTTSAYAGPSKGYTQSDFLLVHRFLLVFFIYFYFKKNLRQHNWKSGSFRVTVDGLPKALDIFA